MCVCTCCVFVLKGNQISCVMCFCVYGGASSLLTYMEDGGEFYANIKEKTGHTSLKASIHNA